MNDAAGPIARYRAIPEKLQHAVDEIGVESLDSLVGSAEMSAREVVHHLTEANIVTASMLIAALGASGSSYDWSWLWPNREWCDRMRYASVPVEPALDLMTALVGHISILVEARPEALQNAVTLFDSPGAETYQKTIAELLVQEADHADEHLDDLLLKARE